MNLISRKECPKQILEVTKYTGRKVEVVTSNEVTIGNTYWDGGSKTEWFLFSLITGEIRGIPMSLQIPGPMGGIESAKAQIPDGWVVVEDAWFQGKRCTLRLHAAPTIALLLIASADKIA